MRLGTKVRLLSDPFKADAAIETVYEAARAHGVEPEGGVLDLTKYYFGDVEAAPDIVQLPDDSPSDMVAGRCVRHGGRHFDARAGRKCVCRACEGMGIVRG